MSKARRVLPYIPDLPYNGDYPQLSLSLDQVQENILFTRYGSGKPGPYHCFVDDWRLEGIWRDPRYRFDKAVMAETVVAPDFSVFPHYPETMAMYQVWRSRLIAAWWMSFGVTVIPVMQWTRSDDPALPRYFAGLEQCKVVAVRAPTRGFEDDWLRCAEIFQRNQSCLILHFGPKRGSHVWDDCRVLPLNPSVTTDI